MSIVTNEAETKNELDQEKFAGVIRIDQQEVRSHVEEVVRESVEETLNGLLDAEADELCEAEQLRQANFTTCSERQGTYVRPMQSTGVDSCGFFGCQACG